MTPSQRFAAVVEEFRGKAGVTVPSSELGRRRKFGASGLKIKGKVFAMISSNGDFVVKLPRERVDKLVAAFGDEIQKYRETHPADEQSKTSDEKLLNGPQLPDEASKQADIDALLASFD